MSAAAHDERRLFHDPSAAPGLRPSLRSNGVGFPGYKADWFKLRNGRKGLLFVTDTDRIVHIPTQHEYDLLLSVDAPDRFLDALRTQHLATP